MSRKPRPITWTVNTETGCHEVTSHKGNINGYPRIMIKGKNIRISRLAWEASNGPIPDGMFVLHKCDNPHCINLEHLYLGTLKENSQDAINRGRHKGRCALMTPEAVAYIREHPEISSVKLQEVVGYHHTAIRRVRRYETHKNLT